MRGTDGFDDLALVDALQVDRRDTEVRVAKLTLMTFSGTPLAGHLDGVRVAELI